MATKPKTGAKDLTSEIMPKVLNTVIDNMPDNQALPRVAIEGEKNNVTGRRFTKADSLASLREIGQILVDMPQVANNFYQTMWNLVAFVIIRSRLYENPLAKWTKKGIVEVGEVIEDVWVGIAEVFQFSPYTAEKNVFKRVIDQPPVAFYRMNFQKFYKMTFSVYETRQAFLSFQGVTDMLNKKIEQMYTGMNYDEYLVTKYMMARAILNGYMYPIPVQQVSGSTARDVTTTISASAQTLGFMKNHYNMAGVLTYTDIRDLLIFLTPEDYANFKVQVLAMSFNRDDAELMGNVIVFDGFTDWDTDRLEKLFTDENGVLDPDFVPFTADDLEKLKTSSMFACDKEFFQIYDNLLTSDNLRNGEGLYTNYWLHAWKTFGISPFSNAVAYVNGTPAITSVEITPTEVASPAGSDVQFMSTVVAENLASKNVNWSVTGATEPNETFIDYRGLLRIGKHETAAQLTVTAKSAFDPTKTATATVTVGNAG